MEVTSFDTWETLERAIREKTTPDYFKELFQKVGNTKILIVGETIIDEYVFVEPMGHSPKGNLISTKYQEKEFYAGGILACAQHTAAFSEYVGLVTCLGASDSRVEFVTRILSGGRVGLYPLFRRDAPTTVNTRFVRKAGDGSLQKLFGVYRFKHEPLDAHLEKEVIAMLQHLIPSYDVVLAVDYGHGFFTPAIREMLANEAPFLALNVQTNSTNFGFNSLYKFSRADYVCIDELEGQICEQNKFIPRETLVRKIAERMNVRAVGVTLGRRGAIFYNASTDMLFEIPALLTQSRDTVGTGDAYLSVTTPFIACGAPPEIIAFLGGVAGSLASETVCNKETISKSRVEDIVKNLF